MGLNGSTPEDGVVAAAMCGEQGARDVLWRAHRRWLAAILLAHKPRDVDLEDLMQDVAVKFVAKLHTLRDPEAFRPWLRRIAVNAAREAGRSMSYRRTVQADLNGELTPADGAAGSIPAIRVSERDDAHGLLAHALTLPEEFREPLLLRLVQGLGCKQIAELLELPVTTIETRLSRARRMLREEWIAKQAPARPLKPAAAAIRASHATTIPAAGADTNTGGPNR